MPGYKGHLAGGCVAYGVTLGLLHGYCTSLMVALCWLLCALAGSLFPDIDVKSKGQKYFYWIILGFFLLLIIGRQFKLLAVSSIASVFPMLVKHRGIFHRAWFVVAAPLVLWTLISTYAPFYSQPSLFAVLFFIAGALSHLWLDMGLKGMVRL